MPVGRHFAIAFALLIALPASWLSGCQTARRAPDRALGSAASGDSDAELAAYRQLLSDHVRMDLQLRERLHELHRLTGSYPGSAREARELVGAHEAQAEMRARGSSNAQHSTHPPQPTILAIDEERLSQLRAFLARIEGLESLLSAQSSRINQYLRERPELTRLLVTNHRLRIDIDDPGIVDADLFPLESKRVIRIERLADFAPGAQLGSDRTIRVDNLHHEHLLEISNRIPLPPGVRKTRDRRSNAYALYAELDCDQPVKVKRSGTKDISPRLRSEFTLFHQAGKVELVLPRVPVRCTLRMTPAADRASYPLVLQIESEKAFERDRLLGRVREACLYPDAEAKGGAEKFVSMNYGNSTCMAAPRQVKLLPDELESFQIKMQALTGARIPQDMIDRKDPLAALDFSQAPPLDVIVLTTLEFKNDFFGNLIARALQWQADRGAVIRIIVPKISALLKPRDERLLRDLEAWSPNIAVHYFEYAKFGIGRLHRNIHAKLLVTLSREKPEHDFVITGGRNVKDTFLFHETPDYSSEPRMTQYGTEEPYFFFRDLEVGVWDTQTARQVAAQVLSLWNRDHDTLVYRPTTIHVPSDALTPDLRTFEAQKSLSTTHLRHLISLPYVDDRQMEQLFIDLLDHARASVKLVSQYFRPTKKIAEALHRAIKRGVEVSLVTRLTLAGDNVPGITEQINRASVNRFFEKMRIYNWKDGNSFLHAKAVLVDREVLYVGGTNLNRRSFVHDIENGFVITGPEVIDQFDRLYETVYLPGSELVTERRSVDFIVRLLLPFLGSLF